LHLRSYRLFLKKQSTQTWSDFFQQTNKENVYNTETLNLDGFQQIDPFNKDNSLPSWVIKVTIMIWFDMYLHIR